MSVRSRGVGFLITALLATPLLIGFAEGVTSVASHAAPAPTSGAARRADCYPGDSPETGLQGQVPLVDQATLRSRQGYWCNVTPVGQNGVGMRGGNFQLTQYGDCAYVGAVSVAFGELASATWQFGLYPQLPGGTMYGIAVLDITDHKNPKVVEIMSQDMQQQYVMEGLHTNAARKIMMAEGWGANLDLFDISDCRHPVLKSQILLSETEHAGEISPDGNTVYISGGGSSDPTVTVVDVRDISKPKILMTWNMDKVPGGGHNSHDFDISEDGTRLYMLPYFSPNGIVIADVSDIQFHRPNPQIKFISRLDWPKGLAHTVRWGTIGDRKVLIADDERGYDASNGAYYEDYCKGNDPYGYARIIDITDELRPKLLSTFKLEVSLAENCNQVVHDGGNYNDHYGGLDDQHNTTMWFATWWNSGLRVFDVRDPFNVKEIGYYNPPPGVGLAPEPYIDLTPNVDITPSYAYYDQAQKDIWFVSWYSGFHIVKLTHPLKPQTSVESANVATQPAAAASAQLPSTGGASGLALLPLIAVVMVMALTLRWRRI